ncbi:MAG: hypothetical protein FH758_02095 [Firmicutes bacterium]|nr:hypothetical protein [Bacillota bacterium]
MENRKVDQREYGYGYAHVHDHTGITSCNDKHCHVHPGVTGPAMPCGDSHYHKIVGATTFRDNHYHEYNAKTSPAVQLPGGYHTHYGEFKTTYVDGHIHNIKGYIQAVMAMDYCAGYDTKTED